METGQMERIFTVEEVAEYLKVRPKVIVALIRHGKLKAKEIARQVWRVKEADLQEYIQEGGEK